MWNYPSAKAANSTRSSFPVASSSAAGWMPRRNGGLRSTRPIGAFGFEGRAQRGTTGFCLTSNTDWQAASITHATAQQMMVRGLIERQATVGAPPTRFPRVRYARNTFRACGKVARLHVTLLGPSARSAFRSRLGVKRTCQRTLGHPSADPWQLPCS